MPEPVVKLRNVDIVFGEKPDAALPLIDEGKDRSQIQEETGQVLGVAGCSLDIVEGEVRKFEEKPRGDGALINGGYFVLSPKVIDRIEGDATTWEQEPVKGLSADNQWMAFKHEMDKLLPKNQIVIARKPA